MKVERETVVFRPITITLETQEDVNKLIQALQEASRETRSGAMEAYCDLLVRDLQSA